MPTSFIIIQNKVFQFDHHYRDNDDRREQLCQMTQDIWDFSLESWYRFGGWGDECVPYSLFDYGQIVSHVTATTLTFALGQKRLRALQLGTVMTDPEYTGIGLSSWLIERVLADYENKVDFVFLYANDSVLDFYPRFGFHPVTEYHVTLPAPQAKPMTVKKLDLLLPPDYELFCRLIEQGCPQYRMAPVNNRSLLMLYCGYSDLDRLSDCLYYLPELDAVVIASTEGSVLTLHDLLAAHPVDPVQAAAALVTPQTRKVVLGFVPDSVSGTILPFHEEDTTLFVRGTDLFDQQQLCLPITART